MIKPSLTFKIVTAGEGGVGKTTMLRRYVDGQFVSNMKMTIGVDIFEKELILNDGVICSLQLWDFGGQERFRFFLESFVRGASGAFLMFDLTNQLTLDNLKNWIEIVRKDDSTLPIVLLGAKYDLDDLIVVDDDMAKEFVEDNDLSRYCKISSKTGYNVKEIFKVLTEIIIEHKGLKAQLQSVKA